MKPIVSPANIAALTALDPVFEGIIEKYGLPPNWSRPAGFATLCQIIIEQQVSLDSAAACYRKLQLGIGDITPTNIDAHSAEELRQYSLSRQKARYLKCLATATLEGSLNLDALPNLPQEQARAQLTAVVGIGQWTSDIYLMFCLAAPDIFPMGDIAAINTVKELWTAPDRAAIEKLQLKWSPFRSLATFCCWHYYLEKRGRKAHY